MRTSHRQKKIGTIGEMNKTTEIGGILTSHRRKGESDGTDTD